VTRITDKMFYVAAVACMNAMTPEEEAQGRTFPELSRIREVSHAVAVAVVEEALAAGLTTKIKKENTGDALAKYISNKMYFPSYHPLLGMKDNRRH
jgi:malate dehydrogenase (oxaloacetate-decarboxylating)(NADP+)